MYTGFHVKYLFIRFLMKLEFNLTDFLKILKYQIHYNSASVSHVVPHGWTARQT